MAVLESRQAVLTSWQRKDVLNLLSMTARLLLRLALGLAGMVLLASLVVAGLVLLAFALGRALWCRLTGQPVPTWRFGVGGVGVDPQAQWSRFRAASSRWTAGPQAPGRSPRVLDDVTDVEVKPRTDRPLN